MVTVRGDRDSLSPEVATWMGLFRTPEAGNWLPVEGVYSDDVRFRDPVRTLRGREALDEYFAQINRMIVSGGFTYHEVVYGGDVAWVRWTMQFTMRRRPQHRVDVEGASRLVVSGGLVAEQVDLYDAGRAVYEQIPLLGMAVRLARRNL